jgi:hypothetical protein
MDREHPLTGLEIAKGDIRDHPVYPPHDAGLAVLAWQTNYSGDVIRATLVKNLVSPDKHYAVRAKKVILQFRVDLNICDVRGPAIQHHVDVVPPVASPGLDVTDLNHLVFHDCRLSCLWPDFEPGCTGMPGELVGRVEYFAHADNHYERDRNYKEPS